MTLATLDHRHQAVLELVAVGAACPAEPHEADLYNLLTGANHSPEVRRAHNIFSHEFKREVLESFLLVNTDAEDILEILQVPIVITEIYTYLFFDATAFEDELDRIDYAFEYAKSVFGKELKQFAVNMGKDCLKVRLSHGDYTVNATTVQNNIRSTAFMMASLVRVDQVDAALANAALKWAQVGLKAVEGDKGVEEAGALDQLKMALQTNEEATNEEQSGIPAAEILH